MTDTATKQLLTQNGVPNRFADSIAKRLTNIRRALGEPDTLTITGINTPEPNHTTLNTLIDDTTVSLAFHNGKLTAWQAGPIIHTNIHHLHSDTVANQIIGGVTALETL